MNAFALGGLPFLFAFILSCAITYLTILVYRGLGIVDKSTRTDHPKNVHTEPVPRGGGIPIYASMFFVTAMFLQFDPHVAAILGGGLIRPDKLTGIFEFLKRKKNVEHHGSVDVDNKRTEIN